MAGYKYTLQNAHNSYEWEHFYWLTCSAYLLLSTVLPKQADRSRNNSRTSPAAVLVAMTGFPHKSPSSQSPAISAAAYGYNTQLSWSAVAFGRWLYSGEEVCLFRVWGEHHPLSTFSSSTGLFLYTRRSRSIWLLSFFPSPVVTRTLRYFLCLY